MKMTERHVLMTLLWVASSLYAAPRFVSFTEGDFCLNEQDKVSIYVDPNDQKGVMRAARTLATDIEKASRSRSEVVSSTVASIIVGTIRHSEGIDRLVSQGIINKKELQDKREKFIITTHDNQLIIAGSDRRGTIYGIYELSRQLGISPWYFWADVPIARHEHIYIRNGVYTDGEPTVRYRGIFLNDEAPCLTSWVRNTYGTDYGDHRFYERVFELLLRLRANFLWPAMWGWAFYADDELNSKTADEMGIIIGTSHHEPMGRNHQEYARHREKWGAWNYRTNPNKLNQFFREGIERIKNTEDVITIGMRGDGDEAMSAEADTKLLEDIVENQRRIIRQVTHRPAKETPQVWALYKEVMDYYDAGMKVPDDVIFLLCDDNWGNLRRVPVTEKEKKHPGGWGLYYHVDYVGAPRNSKWLNATPSQNMAEQLMLAHQYGISQMWILNVGDLKPMEYPIQLFLDMAWASDSITPTRVIDHTRQFCNDIFGKEQGAEAAQLLNLCCKYNGRSTAEMLDAHTYALNEWQQVVSEYTELENAALRQYIVLQPEYQDAYKELILFPIQAMGNLHRLYQAVAMNERLYEQSNPDCNQWADCAEQAFRRDSLLCADYNHGIAHGKWNGMMTQKHIGYVSWNDDFAPTDVMPSIHRLPYQKGGSIFQERNGAVIIEAEHYYEKKDSAGLHWKVIPDMGRTLSGVSVQPYNQTIKASGGPSLTYRFSTTHPIQRIHIVVKSTLDFLNKGSFFFRTTLDGGIPFVTGFNGNLNEKPENIYSIYYPTIARRVVQETIDLQASAGEHTLMIEPLDPAIVFEKIIIDCGGYQPQFLFGKESPRRTINKEQEK